MIAGVLHVDSFVLQSLYHLRTVPLTYFFIDVSEFGRLVTVVGLLSVFFVFLFHKKRFADLAGLVISVVGAGETLLLIKVLVSRVRPEFFYQAYPEGPLYSFPSAHAGLSIALYGYIAYLLLQERATFFKTTVINALPVLIALVGFSRLYLGVHYFSDVIAGFAVGGFFLWLGIKARLQLLVTKLEQANQYRRNRQN